MHSMQIHVPDVHKPQRGQTSAAADELDWRRCRPDHHQQNPQASCHCTVPPARSWRAGDSPLSNSTISSAGACSRRQAAAAPRALCPQPGQPGSYRMFVNATHGVFRYLPCRLKKSQGACRPSCPAQACRRHSHALPPGGRQARLCWRQCAAWQEGLKGWGRRFPFNRPVSTSRHQPTASIPPRLTRSSALLCSGSTSASAAPPGHMRRRHGAAAASRLQLGRGWQHQLLPG
jgi:hypothetical protein